MNDWCIALNKTMGLVSKNDLAGIGFAIANVFPILFSAALQRNPDHYNEVSGLMVMGISGGAFITFIVGLAADITGTQTGGLAVLLAVLVYLLITAFRMKKA